MSRIRVVLAADCMKAEVEVTPGPAATAQELEQALQGAGVRHGVDAAALAAPAAASLRDGVQMMRTAGVRRLPVLDGMQVVGLLSSSDVFAALLR